MHYTNIIDNAVTRNNGLPIHIFGRNADVDIAAVEDIWTVGGAKTWNTTASTIEAISSSANDTAAGTGTRIILVQGVDEDYNLISESLIMNGAAATAASTLEFLEIYRVYSTTVGSGGVNAGTITVRKSGAGATFTTIPVHATLGGVGISQSIHFIVPASKGILLYGFYLGVSGTAKADFVIWRQKPDEGKSAIATFTAVEGFQYIPVTVPIGLPEQTKLWIAAKVDTDNTEITAAFDAVLV